MTEMIRGREVIERHLDHGGGKQTPKRIVVHAMGHQINTGGGNVLYAASFLDKIGLSAHILVAPDGSLIRCREDDEVAWHAKGHNTDSLGIEILVEGEHNYESFLEAISKPWVLAEQYRAAVDMCAHWCHKYQIPTDKGRFDRHSDIDPERKSDPGDGFPWARFIGDVEQAR